MNNKYVKRTCAFMVIMGVHGIVQARSDSEQEPNWCETREYEASEEAEHQLEVHPGDGLEQTGDP